MTEINSEPLPFEPKGLPANRARYADALWPVYSVERIRHLGFPGPGRDRKHVFDFKSGLRLIISREYAALNPPQDRGPFLHVSASWSLDAQAQNLNNGKVPMVEVVRSFLYISRSDNSIKPVWTHVTDRKVLHILFPDPLDGAMEPPGENSPPGNNSEPTT